MSRKIIIEQAANVLYRQREQPDLTEHAEELREE